MEKIRAKKAHFAAGLITVGVMLMLVAAYMLYQFLKPQQSKWKIQSIDTMKYSRDLAREKLNDPSFSKEIETQTALIAETGATHVAIGTPYDEEFLPFLRKWVIAARKNGLNVWFRGNFSGWEGWFEYPGISREEHTKLVERFILENSEIFLDGDLFSSCPECENGGPGDPRTTKDVAGYRNFLAEEYAITKKSFGKIKKKVSSNLFSMNYDVASLVMDKTTTKRLDGVVTIDHYVKSPEKLNNDITILSQKSGGEVVLGEFGAPVPDIHGNLSEIEQSEWLNRTLTLLHDNPHLIGLNYWVGKGGSTHIWNDDNSPRGAQEELKKGYSNKQ